MKTINTANFKIKYIIAKGGESWKTLKKRSKKA